MVKEKYNIQKEQTSINITNSAVDSVRFLKTNKTGFRVYENGKIGISGVEGEYDEAAMFDQAIRNLDVNIEYKPTPAHDIEQTLIVDTLKTSSQAFIIAIESLIAKLHAKYPNFIFSNKMNLDKRIVDLSNDQNTKLHFEDTYYSLALLIKEKSSGNIMDMAYEGMTREYNEANIISDISDIIDNFYNVVTLPAGKYPVIIDFEYLSSKFANDLNSLILMSGASLFSGKIGEQVFSPKVTIMDNRNPNDVFGSAFFDAEGVVNPNYQFKVIEQGVIKTPFVAKKEALLYNLPITGSADGAYDTAPGCSPNALTIEKCDMTLNEILNGEKAILVLIASGGDFTPSGDYACPVQLAYLVENGKIVGRVNDMSIAGNIFNLFGDDYMGRPKDSLLKSSASYPIVLKMNVQ